jgi:hypothetical protein
MAEGASSFSKQLASVALAAAVLAALGCDAGDRVKVSGTVNFDGLPLDTGSLEFRNLEGTGVVALAQIANGSYRVTADAKLRPGTYRIVISSPRASGRKISAPAPGLPAGAMTDEIVESLPSRYNTSSELQKTVSRGMNQLDFDLERRSVAD